MNSGPIGGGVGAGRVEKMELKMNWMEDVRERKKENSDPKILVLSNQVDWHCGAIQRNTKVCSGD